MGQGLSGEREITSSLNSRIDRIPLRTENKKQKIKNKAEKARREKKVREQREPSLWFFVLLWPRRRTDFILSLQACGLQRGCHVVKLTAEPETRDSRRRMLVRRGRARIVCVRDFAA